MNSWIDLRSDTVTLPTQAMRDAMYTAEVGDDVFEDDPTIKELETYAAKRLGKEAALFVTSGTQGNACAVLAQTRRGDCIILARGSHISDHEAGSYAQLAGVSLRFPNAKNGIMEPSSVKACITYEHDDIQTAPTGLIVMENAHSSGNVLPLDNMQAIYNIAHRAGIPVHLDGARLFNAAVSLGVDAKALTACCDTVNVCLSKGLCAPVGSILAGPTSTIARAKRIRKVLGGGMRQAGFLAAAGLIALRDMPEQIYNDHKTASYLSNLLSEIPSIHVQQDRLKINMIFFTTDWSQKQMEAFPEYMKQAGCKILGNSAGEFRFVTHHGIDQLHCDHVITAIRSFVSSFDS